MSNKKKHVGVKRQVTSTEAKNQRRYFRIEYPIGNRPQIIHHVGKFPVYDLSEGGLSFEVDPAHTFLETEKILADVNLVSGTTQAIKGRVKKVIGRKIIVEFIDPIPLARIMEEERYLVQRGMLKAE